MDDLLEEQLRVGDEQALAALFARHRQRLLNIVSFRLDPRMAARVDPDDVLQEAFMAARSDLFSLGGVLYTLCTRTRPFRGETLMVMLAALALDDPPPVHKLNPRVPQALSDLIRQLMMKDPAARPASAAAVVAVLKQLECG